MKAVGIDYFRHFRHPSRLRAGTAGALAFLVRQPDFEENTYTADVWLYRNGGAAPLTSGGDVRSFWWQGDDIVFSSLRKKKDKERAEKGLPLTVLHRISPEGPGEAQEWLRLPHRVADTVFLGPEKFLFLAGYSAQLQAILDEAGDDEQAAKMLEEERDYEVLTELPFWLNGEGFISGCRSRLYLYDSGTITPLTDEKTEVEQMHLAPSGAAAYYTCMRYETLAPLDNSLMRLDLATLASEEVGLPKPFYHNTLLPLSDGALWFTGSDNARYGINQNNGFFRLDDEGIHTLYDDFAYTHWDSVGSDVKMAAPARPFEWQGRVYWHSTLGDSSQLMSIDPKTGDIRQETREKGAVMEFAEAGGTLYISALRGLAGTELYSVAAGGAETRLTDFNSHLHSEYALSPPEEISFENSEGVRITGWLLRPIGFEEGNSYPAILDIHGGPKTVYGTVLYHEMQYWASLGFAVLFCNPTGGDGRGSEFADIRGRYGLIDYEDIMQFTDTVLAQNPWIDTARLGVTGGSYGGFMTNWIIGHTDRFAAAASQRSISNWASMGTMADIGYYFAPDQTAGDLWGDYAAVWEQSPLKYADKATTPTLFIHSDEDYRCPLAEGLQMYGALQANGVPSRLCLFRGENHELSRSGKPRHRVRRLREITGWFETYLLPDGAPPEKD